MVIIVLFVIVVSILTLLSSPRTKLGRKLENLEVSLHTPNRKIIREIFYDDKGIKIVKDGENIVIDIQSEESLYRRILVPNISEPELKLLIKAIIKADSVLIEKKK